MEIQDKILMDDTLEQAKSLVTLLEKGQFDEAKEIIDGLSQVREASLFTELGKLTRQIHEALSNFQLDGRITGLAAQDIPDAKERLNYVIETTEKAANTTMDSVESCIPKAENIQSNADELLKDWGRLKRRELNAGEFRELASRMEDFLGSVSSDSQSIHSSLTEVLMAQGYQDLTGQVIRKVITMVQHVEESLVELIKMFGSIENYQKAQETEKEVEKGVEGPIIDQTREDVLTNQDDVDDLLSSLGF